MVPMIRGQQSMAHGPNLCHYLFLLMFYWNTVVLFFFFLMYYQWLVLYYSDSGVIGTDCMATKPKIFTLWPFIENVCQSSLKTKSC